MAGWGGRSGRGGLRRSMSSRAAHLAIAAALATFVHAAPASAGDSTAGCLDDSAGEAIAAGDDEGPPHFSDAFFRTTFALDASTDGFTRRYLAISIEEVCNVPKAVASQ